MRACPEPPRARRSLTPPPHRRKQSEFVQRVVDKAVAEVKRMNKTEEEPLMLCQGPDMVEYGLTDFTVLFRATVVNDNFQPLDAEGKVGSKCWSQGVDVARFVFRFDKMTEAQMKNIVGEENYKLMGQMAGQAHGVRGRCFRDLPPLPHR